MPYLRTLLGISFSKHKKTFINECIIPLDYRSYNLEQICINKCIIPLDYRSYNLEQICINKCIIPLDYRSYNLEQICINTSVLYLLTTVLVIQENYFPTLLASLSP